MAYNNGFPVTYPQYYPQYTQPQIPQIQQPTQMLPSQMSGTSQPQAVSQMSSPTNNLIWVQGEAGAKSYLVAPNTTVQLWDSEEQVIYLKSADASGMPSMKILDYKIRESAPQNNVPMSISQPETGDFVTRDELQAFEDKIQKQLEKLSAKPKKEAKNDE